MKLSVATCQFPTSAEVTNNFQHIAQLIRDAKSQGADVAHFPEACLSGYAGSDLATYNDFDWPLLRHYANQLVDLAGDLKLWVVLGSAH